MPRRLMGIRVSEETWSVLKAKAEEEGRTPSDLARFLLEASLGLRAPSSHFGLGVADSRGAYSTGQPVQKAPKPKAKRKPKDQ